MNESQRQNNGKSAEKTEKTAKTDPPSDKQQQKSGNSTKTTVQTDPLCDNVSSDDLAILSVYVSILSSVIGLAALYLAKAEKASESAQAEPTPVAGGTTPVGVLRNRTNVRKKRKMKKSRP